MKDNTDAGADKADEAPDKPDQKAGNPTDPGNKQDNPPTKRFLGYENEEEAEKGLRELRAFSTRVTQENAELRKRIDGIEQASTARQADETERQHEQRLAQVAKRIADLARTAEDPQEVLANEMLKVQRGMALDMADLVERKVQQELAKLSGRLEDYDPDYRANKREIDRLVEEYGIDRTSARKLFEKEIKAKSETATASLRTPRVEKPGSIRNARVSTDGDDELPELEPWEISKIKSMGFDDKDTKEVIESTRKAKAAMQRRV